MTKILILGSNSFIARSLLPIFKIRYGQDVVAFNRQQLDITDINQLKDILELYRPEYVINCAIHGGRLLKQYSADDFYHNVLMIENLLYLQDYYDKLIHFSSGAQEDRTKDVINLKEGEFYAPPKNFYSLSKYFTAKRLIGNNKVLNFRIFNTFGALEANDRFIKSNIIKYINKQPIEIWGNKDFDFFYINDLYLTLQYFIDNPPKEYLELNCVYKEKYLLSEIVYIINKLSNYKVEIKITDGINRHYTGDGSKLAKLNLPLVGLEKGIYLTYKELLNGISTGN